VIVLDRLLDDVRETPARVVPRRDDAFVHEALFYAGDGEFLEGTVPFIRAGVDADEPVLVVVDAAKIKLLREALGEDGEAVHFSDMAGVGHNPARIIPAWREFVSRYPGGRRVRGIGEPIWPGRTDAELVECHRHEALLNLAFANARGFWLLCPYDIEGLDPEVIAESCRNHPLVVRDGVHKNSAAYTGLGLATAPFDVPLPEPAVPPSELVFQVEALSVVRRFVSFHAERVGMSVTRAQDLVLAVNEVAANSARHASGRGVLRIWQDGNALVCEIRDDGWIDEPLAGRIRPAPDSPGGYGLWLANQLCDLVQVRSFATGSVVRLRMERA
jgi:anti-sigma regulatory factor (Ser/Thr protein kinase)